MAKSKIFAVLFTALVIGLLVVAGPAQAFSLSLDVDKTRPEKGELVTFTAEINIESGETLPIELLILELNGPEKISCTFDVDGNPLTECRGIKIIKTQDSEYGYGYDYNFGYGYGYTEGKLSYSIELDTSYYKIGSYTTKLKVRIDDEIFSQQGSSIKIRPPENDGRYCYPEWSCDDWGPCINGFQYRTCYRNLNYCELEEKPEETRICLAEDNEKQKIILNNQIRGQSRATLTINGLDFKESGRFIIILLLLNCIITTLNLIVRVNELRTYKARLPKLPKPSKK